MYIMSCDCNQTLYFKNNEIYARLLLKALCSKHTNWSYKEKGSYVLHVTSILLALHNNNQTTLLKRKLNCDSAQHLGE